MRQLSAEELYERYDLAHERQGVTVRSWNELGDLEKNAWKAVARFVFAEMFGGDRNA